MKLTRILAMLMLALALGLAACGDDDDEGSDGGDAAATTEESTDDGGGSSEPGALTVTLTDAGVEVSGEATPGVTEVTLDNQSKKPGTAQLIKVEGDVAEDKLIKDYLTIQNSGKIAEYIRAEGGVATVAPGETDSAFMELEEGNYYAFDDEDGSKSVKQGRYTPFEVAGEANTAEFPDAATVTASEYKFETDGPLPLDGAIKLENVGQEVHHVIAFPLKKGKTAEDAAKFFETEKGPPPIAGEPGGTSALDGGKSLVANLTFKKPGTYALVCFIQDRAGGPPHLAKGMISEAVVE